MSPRYDQLGDRELTIDDAELFDLVSWTLDPATHIPVERGETIRALVQLKEELEEQLAAAENEVEDLKVRSTDVAPAPQRTPIRGPW